MTNWLHALHGLHEGHVLELSRLTARERFQWQLERYEGYDGDLTVLMAPAEWHACEKSPSFVIYRTQTGFHLAVNRHDDYAKLGRFTSMEELVTKLWDVISRTGGSAGLGSTNGQTLATSRSGRPSDR